ncbi:MATE family efflux transporter [Spirochaetia bacterium]|nr:MATE family efflux transporter [Spirochaetia bacterium]
MSDSTKQTDSAQSILPMGKRPEGMSAADRLGIEPVGKLLLRFSIPAISGMLVNALYNVVDRIFVGRGVNEVALGGLSLVLPLMTISMAFAMLFGIGSANMISMRLGQGRREEAENALNHCFCLLLLMGIIFMAAGLVFMEPLLSVLGAQKGSEALSYSREYFRIILYGSIFSMVGFGFSHCTRAQGFPNITMISMFIGAGLNMLLDPLFIFVFQWGVEGAAWATIISQLASLIWILAFSFGKQPVIKLRLKTFKPALGIIGQIIAFGSAQFILQFIMSGVQLLYNTSMGWYGAEALGAQPILGYNYGAKKYRRVLKAYLGAITAATAICTLGFAIGELFPDFLIRIFAPDGSEALLKFAPWAMRVMMIMLPLNGFQIVSTNMYVVTGRPKVSIFLSMLRQFIVLIPCILIFGKIWGLHGVIAAAPVADGFAILLTGIMIFFELKRLRAMSKAEIA